MHPFLLYFLISVAFHLFFYVFWRKAVARSEKALAWGLTLEISSLYTLLGVHWLWAFCTSLARGTTLVLLKGTTPFDNFCVLFMMGYVRSPLCLFWPRAFLPAKRLRALLPYFCYP